MSAHITVGAGKNRPQGCRVALPGDSSPASALKAVLERLEGDTESWWSPHIFKAGTVPDKDGKPTDRPDDYRHGDLWQGSIAIAIDADNDGHAAWEDVARKAVLSAIVNIEIPGAMAHFTPHGLRIIFPFTEPVTDVAAWKRAAAGACKLVGDALLAIDGVKMEIDVAASCDTARFYWAPRAVVDDVARDGQIFFLRDRAWTLEELAAHAPATATEPKKAEPVADEILPNDRHETLMRLAASLRGKGLKADEIYAALQKVNEGRCKPPKPDAEIRALADYFDKKEGANLGQSGTADVERFSKIAVGMNTLLAMEIEKPASLLGDGVMSGFQVAMLVGIAGTGKTFVEEELALCLVRGTPFYGLAIPEGGVNVGAIMLEGHVYNYRERLKALAAARGGSRQEDERLKIISRPILKGSVMVLDADTRAALVHWIRTEELAVVIIDPLKNAHDCDENSNRDMGAVIAAFQSIADETGTTFLIVHHESPKAAGDGKKRPAIAAPRGASRLVDDIRCLMLLSKTEGGLHCLSFPKVSYGRAPEPIYLLQDEGTGIFEVTDTPEKHAARKSDRSREKVKSALLQEGPNGLTIPGLIEETRLKKNTIYGYLKELGAVSNGATRQPRYRLPSEQSESSESRATDSETLCRDNDLGGRSSQSSNSGGIEPSGVRTVPPKGGNGFGTDSATGSTETETLLKLVPPPEEAR